MSPAQLLSDLTRQGFTLTLDDNGIRIRPASRLPDNVRRQIREHKTGLLRLLSDDAAVCEAIERDQGLPAGSLILARSPKYRWLSFAICRACPDSTDQWRYQPKCCEQTKRRSCFE